MEYHEGFVYHIKDAYFQKVHDEKLMQNKENGHFRPTFYCLKDEKTSLLWVVPMSSRVDKYQAIVNKQESKYGSSLGIYIGEFDGKMNAFLIQNMFPITEQYLDHVHTRNGNPVPVKASVRQEVVKRMKKAKQLIARGKKVVFPDVVRLESMMQAELLQRAVQAESNGSSASEVDSKGATPYYLMKATHEEIESLRRNGIPLQSSSKGTDENGKIIIRFDKSLKERAIEIIKGTSKQSIKPPPKGKT